MNNNKDTKYRSEIGVFWLGKLKVFNNCEYRVNLLNCLKITLNQLFYFLLFFLKGEIKKCVKCVYFRFKNSQNNSNMVCKMHIYRLVC